MKMRHLCRGPLRGRGFFKILFYIALMLFVLLSIHTLDTLSDCTGFNFDRRPRFMCMKFRGNLGDQMFQYAFLVASRIRYSTDIVLPYDSLLPLAFDVMPQNEFMRPFCNCFKTVQENQITTDVTEFSDNILNSDILFSGRFRSQKYFQKHENEIRVMFRIRPWLKALSQKILRDKLNKISFQGNLTLVGLYLGERDGERKQIHEDLFIRKAMNIYKNKYEHVFFIVCLDMSKWHNWINHDFWKSDDVILVEETREDILLGILTITDHFILLGDSISWWAAWLRKGSKSSVLYFYHPFHSLKNNNLPSKDLNSIEFLPEWTNVTVS